MSLPLLHSRQSRLRDYKPGHGIWQSRAGTAVPHPLRLVPTILDLTSSRLLRVKGTRDAKPSRERVHTAGERHPILGCDASAGRPFLLLYEGRASAEAHNRLLICFAMQFPSGLTQHSFGRPGVSCLPASLSFGSPLLRASDSDSVLPLTQLAPNLLLSVLCRSAVLTLLFLSLADLWLTCFSHCSPSLSTGPAPRRTAHGNPPFAECSAFNV